MADRTGGNRLTAGLYPMRVVEQLTGLSRRQIRYYEEQGLLAPDRSRGGHRLYAPEDVDLLLLIKSLMGRGFKTMEAVKRCLASGLRLSGQRKPASPDADRLFRGSTFASGALSPESDAEAYFQRHRRWPQG